MITRLTNIRVELARSGLLNIQTSAGLNVACESGLVWVTVEGEPADYWLVAGDALAVSRSGRVVIEAAQQSRIALHEPERAPRPFWAEFGRRAAQLLTA
jgi:hypothetical protein